MDNTFSTTHDGQMVYPASHELPEWAHGWTLCDNKGGGYAVWLSNEDCDRAAADLVRLEQHSKTLRTRVQCEAALEKLGLLPCQIGGSCKSMRTMYVITAYRDLWPLRQASK